MCLTEPIHTLLITLLLVRWINIDKASHRQFKSNMKIVESRSHNSIKCIKLRGHRTTPKEPVKLSLNLNIHRNLKWGNGRDTVTVHRATPKLQHGPICLVLSRSLVKAKKVMPLACLSGSDGKTAQRTSSTDETCSTKHKAA